MQNVLLTNFAEVKFVSSNLPFHIVSIFITAELKQ
jgi:hypothetical protein